MSFIKKAGNTLGKGASVAGKGATTAGKGVAKGATTAGKGVVKGANVTGSFAKDKIFGPLVAFFKKIWAYILSILCVCCLCVCWFGGCIPAAWSVVSTLGKSVSAGSQSVSGGSGDMTTTA